MFDRIIEFIGWALLVSMLTGIVWLVLIYIALRAAA